MADLSVAVAIVAEDKASGPIRGIASVVESLAGSVNAPVAALSTLTSALGAVGLASVGLHAVADAAKGLGSAIGVGLNASIENVSAQFQAFTKDSAVTAQVLGLVRKEANDTPFGFLELAQAVGGLIPSARQAREPLLDLTRTAEILAKTHPEQGLQGAAFALREAVSGDFTSVIERFDLPRQVINDLKAQGVPNLEIVRRAMAAMGYDIDVVTRASETLEGRWSTFQDALGDVRATLSKPLFDLLKTGLQEAQGLFDRNSERIMAWADVAGHVIADVVSAMARGVGSILSNLAPLGEGLAHAFDALRAGDVSGAIDAIGTGITGAFENIVAGVSGFAKSMFGAGYTLVATLANGIVSGIGAVVDAVGEVVAVIADFLVGNSPPPKGPLSQIDQGGYNVIAAFAGGVSAGSTAVATAVQEVATNFDALSIAGQASMDAVQAAFENAKGSLGGMKSVGLDAAGAIKDLEVQIRDLDHEAARVKYTADAIKDAFDDLAAPVKKALDELKGFRDFAADQKKIDLDREGLAIKQAELQARGNKGAEAAVKARRDEFSARKDAFEIQQQQAELDRRQAALPLEKQLADMKAQQDAILDPLQKQLRVYDEQKKALDFQRKQWQDIKSAIDDAVKAATPTGGGGGGGVAKGAAPGAKTGMANLKDLLPTKEEIDEFASKTFGGAGESIARGIATGAQKWFSAHAGEVIGGGLGAVLGGAVLGPIGAVAGGLLGGALVDAVNKHLAAHGIDGGALVASLGAGIAEVATRVSTFLGSLANAETLATAVNKAFGDLIPPGLNPILDAVDQAFAAIKTTVSGVVSTLQQGGLQGAWQAITTAMSDFAPTGERIQTALNAVGQAIGALVPQPLGNFVSGLIDTAKEATAGTSPLASLAAVVNTVSGAISDATSFVKDHVAVQAGLVAVIAGAATAWGLMTAAQIAQATATNIVSVATKAYAAVQAALNVVLTANPIGILVVALAALAVGLKYAYDNSEEFRTVVDGAFAAVKGAVATAIEAASGFITGFGELLTSVGNTVGRWYATVRAAFEDAQRAVVGAMLKTQVAIETGWDLAYGAVQYGVRAIRDTVQTGWDLVSGVVATAQDAISALLEGRWADFGTIVANAGTAILAKATQLWTGIRDAAVEWFDKIVSYLPDWGQSIVKGLAALVTDFVTGAAKLGKSIVDGIIGAIRDGIGEIGQAARAFAQAGLDAIKGVFKPGSPSRAAYAIAETVPQGIVSAFQDGTPSIAGAARRLAQAALDAVADRIPAFRQVGEDLMVRFNAAMRDTTPDTLAAITSFVDGAKTRFDALRTWLGDLHSGWIGQVAAKRTELLKLFNYQAFVRGEGTKVVPELEELANQFVSNLTDLATKAGDALSKLTTDYQDNVRKAREAAQQQAADAVAAAAARVQELAEQRSLQKRIQAQKDAFAAMLAIQKAAFDAQQNQLEAALSVQEQAYKIAFQAQLKLNRIGTDAAPGVTTAQAALDTQTELLRIDYEASRDLGRAATEDQKKEIAQRAADAKLALQDKIDEERFLAEATKDLRLKLQQEQILAEKEQALQALKDQAAEETYVREQTASLRAEIANRASAFDQLVARQTADFEASLDLDAYLRQIQQINDERDARIAGINDALREKEAALTADLETERAKILDNLKSEVEDLQKHYIDAVVEAFHHAQVDIQDFISTINDDLRAQTKAVANDVLALIGQIQQAKQQIGDTPSYSSPPPYVMPDTTRFGIPQSTPTPVNLGSSLSPVPAAGKTVINNVTVNALTANMSAEDLNNVLDRQRMLAGS